jgi:hypothetical protein
MIRLMNIIKQVAIKTFFRLLEYLKKENCSYMTNSLKNYFSPVYNNLGVLQRCTRKHKILEKVCCRFMYKFLDNE